MAEEFKLPRSKSVVRVAKSALTKDTQARTRISKKAKDATTVDSFVNFAHNLGIGSDNAMTSSTYGFNPITRNRTLLEWIHRGSWLGGTVVDSVADDMTRAGITHKGLIKPEAIEQIDEAATGLGTWSALNDTLKWSRLYGGGLAVLLIDGQDPETPLRLNTIRKGQFRGLLPLDRWMVEPSLADLVTEMGPNLGMPKYYRITAMAPALSGMRVHHSRCVRLEGIRLPYWQRLMENLWGLSVLERLYDRMIAFDSATTGAAQLVYKSYLRTLKIEDMRELIAAGGDAMNGLSRYVDMMRRFQGIEGMTVIDSKDDFTADSHSAFGGLSDALAQFGQQLSGASGIPLVRLFGQSPAGFSTGDADLRNYYDTIKQQQVKELLVPVTKIYRCIAASEGVELPDGYKIEFNPLWQLTDTEKATIAETDGRTIQSAEESGIIDRVTALKELRQSSNVTGRFSNITDEMIQEAETEGPPIPEDVEVAEVRAEGQLQAAQMKAETKQPGKVGDKLQRAAGVMFATSNGRILLLKRADTDQWAFPGGGIEDGETAEQAAIRECLEEVRKAPEGALAHLDQTNQYGADFSTFVAYNQPEFSPNLNNEHTAFKWVGVEEALDLNLHPGVRHTLEI